MIMRKRRTYTKSFKLDVVKRSLEVEEIKSLSEELDIHSNTISRWRREFLQTGEDLSFPGKGVESLTEEQKEIKRLKSELEDSKLELEILKKAISIFSKSDAKSTSSLRKIR